MNIPPTSTELLANSNACFFVTTTNEGVINYANDHFLNTFPSVSIPSVFQKVVSEKQHDACQKIFTDVLNNPGTISAVDLLISNHLGDVIPTHWNFTQFTCKDGQTGLQGLGTVLQLKPDDNHNHQDERINRILESISDGFFTVDKQFTTLYWNHKAEEIFEMKRENILGKNLWEVYEAAIPLKFYTEFHRAFDKNEVVHFQEYLPELDTWFDVSAYPYENILSVFFKDITERKKAEEETLILNERLKLVAKATKDVVWDWDLVSNEVVWNENVTAMFGFSQEYVNAHTEWWYDNLFIDDKKVVEKSLRKHIEDRKVNWQQEYKFKCADGSYKYVFDRGFAIYDSAKRPIRMIGAMQDLTERKASEFILKELNNSLEHRAKELAASNDELERFAYVTSHDLQEPLRMVTSFLQLLQKRYSDKLDPKAHEYIGFAVDGAERMKGLILDLLEYSRVNTSKGETAPVDVNEIAAQVLLTYKDVLRETDGVVNIQELPVVDGNGMQLSQLLQNLVGNALKYRREEPPRIDISYNDNPGEHEFAVKDNGIGIEPRFFEKVFVIFQRLHHKNEYSGTGIGLAICKKIVEKHGGRIWIESEPGKGSVFHFTISKSKRNG